MYQLANNGNGNAYLDCVKEVWACVKLHNSASLLQFTQEDVIGFAKSLQKKYSIDLVVQAKDEILNNYADRDLTLGKFEEICRVYKNLMDKTKATQALLADCDRSEKNITKENLTRIRDMLSERKALKRLPYDKNFRVYADQDNIAEKNKEIAVSDCTFALNKFCVENNFIMQTHEVQNPELKELYIKAWTIGLDADEKDQFKFLAAKYNHY